MAYAKAIGVRFRDSWLVKDFLEEGFNECHLGGPCIVPQRHRHRRDPGVFLFFEALGYGFIAGGHRKGTDEEGVV